MKKRAGRHHLAVLILGLLGLTTLLVVSEATKAPAQSAWWTFKSDMSHRLWGLPEAKPKKPFKIGVSMVSLADYYYVAVVYGLEDEAKRMGLPIERLLTAGGYEHLATQVNQMEDLIASDVDVIFLAAISPEGTAAVVNRAVAQGKKVVDFINGTTNEKVYATIVEDYSGAGVRQAEYQCRRLGAKGGKVAMLNGPAGAQWAIRMHDGFLKTLKQKCPAVKVVDEKWTPLNPGDALKIAEDWFQRYPDLNGIYSVYDTLARGAAPAVKAARKPANFVFTTQGLSPWARDALIAGDLDMTAAAAPVALGRWAVQAAIHAMNGDPAPGLKNALLFPTPTITKDTIKTADTSMAFYPEGFKVPQ